MTNKIKIVFLGTNGWYDTSTGNTICVLIETPNEHVILDAGNGFYKIDQYIKDDKPIYLFLSHYHLDHIVGLHVLAKFKFKQGINICIQQGTKEILMGIFRRPYTASIELLPLKINIIEYRSKEKTIDFLEECLPLQHIENCFGFRFNFDGKIIAYIPDTGFCENAVKLSNKVDLLIAECAFKAGQTSKSWPHLNPETSAKIAKDAKVKKLILAHFDAEVYQTMKDRGFAEKKAREVFKNSVCAKDNQVFYA